VTSTWAILAAGVSMGVGLTLVIAWSFTLSKRVARLEAALYQQAQQPPPTPPPSDSRDITLS